MATCRQQQERALIWLDVPKSHTVTTLLFVSVLIQSYQAGRSGISYRDNVAFCQCAYTVIPVSHTKQVMGIMIMWWLVLGIRSDDHCASQEGVRKSTKADQDRSSAPHSIVASFFSTGSNFGNNTGCWIYRHQIAIQRQIIPATANGSVTNRSHVPMLVFRMTAMSCSSIRKLAQR
jgi:hypothetical protein